MPLTLLFDLDDTLLKNDIDTFLPAYLRLLGNHMQSAVAPEKMVRELLTATGRMVTNNTAALSLERAFDSAFYGAIGHTKEALRDTLEQFYDDVYPGLQPLTGQVPGAADVVEQAARSGHTLVVATNPLFPRKAILHRIRWAGLNPDDGRFRIITTYERFHFAKPNPAYFAEILAQLGWPEQPAVVIGNSIPDDLAPAAKLGLPVFWVTAPGSKLPAGDAASPQFHPLSDAGALEEVPAWLEKVEAAGLEQDFSKPAALVALLKSTAAALDTLSMDLPEGRWYARPAPDEWSLNIILAHMRDVDAEVNIPRLENVIRGANPFLAGINTDTWANERPYAQEDGPTALRQFIEVRTRLITLLEGLNDSDWQHPARHAIFGPTHLRELVSFITTHDRSHVRQAQVTARGVKAV